MSYEEPIVGSIMPIQQALQRVYAAAAETLAAIGRMGDKNLRKHFASRYMMLLAQKYTIVSSTHSLGHRSSNQAAFERAMTRARTCKL